MGATKNFMAVLQQMRTEVNLQDYSNCCGRDENQAGKSSWRYEAHTSDKVAVMPAATCKHQRMEFTYQLRKQESSS